MGGSNMPREKLSWVQAHKKENFLGSSITHGFGCFPKKNPKQTSFFRLLLPLPAAQFQHQPQHSFPCTVQELQLMIFTPTELLFITPQLVMMTGASTFKNKHLPLALIFHSIRRKSIATGPYYQKNTWKLFPRVYPETIQTLCISFHKRLYVGK